MPLLSWHNREEDLTRAARAPYRLLEPVSSLSYGDPDSPNMLIEGDNLDALKALLPYYAGQVKCIFIDPPYNTRSAFEHYNDNLEHSQWLSMMYPRLELLRDLLSEDGSIWITLDDNEAHYFKVIADEVFGRRNFLCDVAWEKRYSPPPDTKDIGYVHDHVLAYRKSAAFERNLLPLTEDQSGRYTNRDDDPRGNWKAMDYTCRYTAEERPNLYYPVIHPRTGEEIWPNRNRVWAFSRDAHERNVVEGRLWWGMRQQNRVPALKNFFREISKGMMPMSLWKHSLAGHNQEAKKESISLFGRDGLFETPKPERLLQTVLHIATDEGDLVLDSFLGSGTTAAVAHKMGRNWIGIETGEHARTHCRVRLAKVVDGEQGGISKSVGWQGGGGFRFYMLGVPVLDENGSIRKDIRFEHLAAHVWFSETGTPRSSRATKDVFLGSHQGIGYYLLFNGILGDQSKAGGNVLTRRVLRTLPVFDGPKVIYGEATDFTADQLAELDITFRQTPYDIKAR